ncbi:MAG TPA: hypothetical protein PLP33_14675 [Leptospiraceae bacterium]|nr:hypothetical protein [Leptospiraceae bacterium]
MAKIKFIIEADTTNIDLVNLEVLGKCDVLDSLTRIHTEDAKYWNTRVKTYKNEDPYRETCKRISMRHNTLANLFERASIVTKLEES